MLFKKRVIIVISILWLGFLLSISFMEAWLKFQAEGVTQAIGLSVGKLVFGALNKVEIFFLITLFITSYKRYWRLPKKTLKYILSGLVVIVLIQTLHLLPILDQRADMIILGEQPSPSYFHFYYVILEVCKAVLLFVFIHLTLTVYNDDVLSSVKGKNLNKKQKH
jgi:hypothetical protein